MGAALGGAQGAATGVTVDVNNRMLHQEDYNRLKEKCRGSNSAECQTIIRMAGVQSGMPMDDPSIPASKVVANYDADGNIVSYVLIDRSTNRPTIIMEPLDYEAYRNATPGMQAMMQLSPQYALDFASAGLYASAGDNGGAAEHVIAGVTSRDYVRDVVLGVAGAGTSSVLAARPGASVRGAVTDANFAQSTIRASETFSAEGAAKYSQLAGRPINTVDDLAAAINSGAIKPNQIPVDYVVTADGTKLILNTRTSVALDRAGIPKTEWYGANQTGVPVPNPTNSSSLVGKTFDDLAATQLKNNKLPATGTPSIPRGKK